MDKAIVMSNDRGYAFLRKIDGCPDLSKTKSMDVHQVKDKTETTFTFFEKEEEGKTRAGNMVKNGYLQVSEYLGKTQVLSAVFKKNGQIVLDKATGEEIDAYRKYQDELAAKKKAEKGSTKTTRENELQRLEKEGVVHQVEVGEGKPKRWEYKKPHPVKEKDDITCLRKNGIFRVKEVNPEKKVINAIDATNGNHFFHFNEVAPAK
jgi:Fe2+ or Zn2+ uptake regulation protein